MDAQYVAAGAAIDHTPGSALAAGAVVIVGSNLVGVATQAIPANTKGSLAVQGIFDLTKAEATEFAAADLVEWDDTANLAVGQYEGDAIFGVCVAAAANGDTTVRVKLMPELQLSTVANTASSSGA